jgi:hypothetical protein
MSDKDDFFIGYGDTPGVDRRFLLGFTLFGLVGAGAVGAALAKVQGPAGGGDWDQGTEYSLTGYVTADPYPMLRTEDLGGGMRTVLLACQTKCGAQAQLEAAALADDRVTVRGSLIQRDRHAMLAVLDSPDWIAPAPDLPARPGGFAEENLGPASLAGMILDSKCWFGAMRPNTGPVHKACATLCIRGGLPPYFYVEDRQGRSRAVMLTDASGGALIDPILPLVADPVRAEGELVRIGDLIQLRADASAITRIPSA